MTMIMWCMIRRSRTVPCSSTSSYLNPRNQPSTGHANRCSGASAPMSIMAWSIGGMFGSFHGPVVMTTSWRAESTLTVTGGMPGTDGPARTSVAASAANNDIPNS